MSVIDVLPIERLVVTGSWALLGGAAGYLAYHFVLVGHQYLRVAVAF